MAMRASTQLGPPGNGCQSPANTTGLLVTIANAASAGASDYNTNTRSYINQNTKIRCTEEGELKTVLEIISQAGATLPSGGINYDVYENWGIQTGEFGGTLNHNFVEFLVNEAKLTGNPSIVALIDNVATQGSMQNVSLANLFNYARAPESLT